MNMFILIVKGVDAIRPPMPAPSHLAFVLFPRLTLLDFVGPYDALRRLRTFGYAPELRWSLLGTTADIVDEGGVRIGVDAVRPSLDPYDLLVLPGGLGADALLDQPDVLDWLATWGDTRPVATICSGALLAGRLGWLRGLPAATHHLRSDALRPYVGEVRTDRVVEAGRIVTSGGVTAGIDLGLHLVRRFWGDEARARRRRRAAGSPPEVAHVPNQFIQAETSQR